MDQTSGQASLLDASTGGIDRKRLLHRPMQVMAYVSRLARHMHRGAERRRRERHIVSIPLVAVPVDENEQFAGPPFRAVTRDVSAYGIGLWHSSLVETPFLAVEFTGKAGLWDLQVLTRVVRSCEAGDSLFDIGLAFVMQQ